MLHSTVFMVLSMVLNVTFNSIYGVFNGVKCYIQHIYGVFNGVKCHIQQYLWCCQWC
jgi:hypothetical protein